MARAPAIIARSRDERAKNLLALRPRGNGNLCPALVTTHASMDLNASPIKTTRFSARSLPPYRKEVPHSPQPHRRRGVHDAGKPWSRRPSARTPAPSQTPLPNSDKGGHRMLSKAVTARSGYCAQPTADDSELHPQRHFSAPTSSTSRRSPGNAKSQLQGLDPCRNRLPL